MKKIKFLSIFMLVFIIILITLEFTNCFALTPILVSRMEKAFENIERWLISLSTPAAAVAVGVGVFMKKFSFGDEEKMRTGKKLIKTSLFSYAFILAIDLILAAIKSLV